ncbi:uncharacterized protein LOC111625053 [Centruroides sculpturatus]|uniref:uncharacterized protein LOC111625053 n=1 Tax=Centruroides sculpturatus TaxID=218467 RepID=UPI000C6C9E72|nr:uncharacterized protein LOC111625053 [Centruroides sculpturatus]
MLISLNNTTSFKIGGPNKTVEIDESVICKRKYEKGRILKSTKWIVGGICKEDKNCFICHVKDRSENTLNWVVYKYVKSGSVIITDEWRSYNHIDDIKGLNIEHKTVNHSKNFVNPKTGDNIQNIERLWGYLKNKKHLPKHYTNDLSDSYLYMFMYKKFMNWPNRNPEERFQIFAKHLSMIYPGTGKTSKWLELETDPSALVSNINKNKTQKLEKKKEKLTSKMNTKSKKSLCTSSKESTRSVKKRPTTSKEEYNNVGKICRKVKKQTD